MDTQIIYYYQRGVASYLIAKKFNVTNVYVRKLLVKNHIPLRGHDITNKVSAKRRTPEENHEITRKAAEANKGSEHTLRHRSRLALAREKNPTIDPVYEQPMIDTCHSLGITVVPQKAFSKYNVDLYLPEYNVVIEIFGGGFHNKREAVDMFNNKIKHLSRKQVPVIIVWCDRLTYNPLNVLTVAQTAKQKVTIIRGDGSPTTQGLRDIILDD